MIARHKKDPYLVKELVNWAEENQWQVEFGPYGVMLCQLDFRVHWSRKSQRIQGYYCGYGNLQLDLPDFHFESLEQYLSFIQEAKAQELPAPVIKVVKKPTCEETFSLIEEIFRGIHI